MVVMHLFLSLMGPRLESLLMQIVFPYIIANLTSKCYEFHV